MLAEWSGGDLPLSGRDVGLWERAEQAINAHRCGNLILRVVDENGLPLQGVPVRYEQRRHAFHFGVWYPYDAPTYDLLQAAGINAATLWLGYSHVQPEPGVFNWGYLDKVWRPEALCQRGLTLTAHALNWFHDTWNVVPEYVRARPAQDLAQFVYEHVSAVVARWGRYIDTFELVNEPFWETTTAFDLDLEDMVRVCHATALAVTDQCPEAHLTVNFTEISRPTTYRVCPANLLDALLAADVTVSSIGLQMLENNYTCTQPPTFFRAKSLAGILNAAHKFSRYEKPLTVSALAAPSLPPGIKPPSYFSPPYGAWDEAHQARYLDLAYTMLFADERIQGITWWAPVDGPLALIPGGGLLREDLSPKPAYLALVNWMLRHTTKGQTYTDAEGSAHVKGYAGDYQVTVGTLERGRSLVHTIEPRLANRVTVVLR